MRIAELKRCCVIFVVPLVILGVVSTAVPPVWAQSTAETLNLFLKKESRASETKLPSVLGLQEERIPRSIPEEAVFALDGIVDPDQYIVGPGDVLGVSLRGGSGWFYQTVITPEGQLIVPRMPMLAVAGLTLNETRDLVSREWGGGERNQIDLALFQIRQIRVSIGGAVVQPGQYIVSAEDRASNLVGLAGGLDTEVASLRRAQLVLDDGERSTVDLLRYYRYGAKQANPKLQAGSHLIVAQREQDAPTVTVGGNVTHPGTYELLSSDHLQELLQVAGGVVNPELSDSVVITHYRPQGDYESRQLPLAGILEGDRRGPRLAPGDLVFVPYTREIPERAVVMLRGEIERPGVYPIVEGQTRLREVLQRAGGLTEHAYLPGGRVWKEIGPADPRRVEASRIDTLNPIRLNALEVQFSNYFNQTMNRDYLSVDFEELFEEDGEKSNIVLFDSLVVEIPRELTRVIVAGMVERPGYYDHVEGYDYKDYIDLAGGYAENAQKSWTRLIPYGQGRWKMASSSDRVQPGDMVFVPEKQPTRAWDEFRGYLGVALQLGTLVVLLIGQL